MRKFAALFVALAIAATLFGVLGVSAASYITQDEYDESPHQSLDAIQGNGANLYTPGYTGDYLAGVDNIIRGPFNTVSLQGWFGVDQPILEYGYVLGDGEPVFDPSFTVQTEPAVIAAGGEFAQRFVIVMDTSALGEELTPFMPVAKLEDGTVLAVTYLDLKYTTKAETAETKPINVDITTGRTDTAINFSGTSSVSFKIVVPEGMQLTRFTVVQSPTWNGSPSGIGLTANIFAWTGDFDETVEGESLGECIVENHKDCSNLDITFDYIPAGEYLIDLTDFTGNIGGWAATGISEECAGSYLFFSNGFESEDTPHVRMSIKEDTDPPAPTEKPTKKPTAEPTQEPAATEAPTEAPTEVPTDVPAVTDAPATEAPNATEGSKASDDTKKDNKWLVPVIIAACVVAAAVIAALAIAASKKKK